MMTGKKIKIKIRAPEKDQWKVAFYQEDQLKLDYTIDAKSDTFCFR